MPRWLERLLDGLGYEIGHRALGVALFIAFLLAPVIVLEPEFSDSPQARPSWMLRGRFVAATYRALTDPLVRCFQLSGDCG